MDDGTLPTDAAGNLPFYLIDAHEEQSMPGTIFLLGKVASLPQSIMFNAEHILSALLAAMQLSPLAPAIAPPQRHTCVLA